MKKLLAQINIGKEFQLKPGVGISDVYNSLGDFISVILPNIYIIAGVILFFLLIGGGIMFIANAGKADSEGVDKAKKTITASLIGFLIIFLSWWIIQIIEAITGINILGSQK